MKHTPGPWVVKPDLDENGLGSFGICKDGDSTLAVTCGRVTPRLIEKARANAQLIAAAPDLLQALEYLLDFVYSRIDWMEYDHAEMVAVIRKAKGETE